MSVTKMKSKHLFVAVSVTTACFLLWRAFYLSSDRVQLEKAGAVSQMSVVEALRVNLNPSGRSTAFVDLATVTALAANAYEPDDKTDAACNAEVRGRIPIPGWSRLTTPEMYPSACNDVFNGLHYELWSNYSDGIQLIAVVFRGTIPNKLVHWCSNLRDSPIPICEPTSDQYLSIGPLIDDVLDRAYDFGNGPDTYVFAIGHSLGGGLAEMAARSSHIDHVFSIDGSPVVAPEVTAALQKIAFDHDEQVAQPLDAESPPSTKCIYVGNQTRGPGSSNEVKVHSIHEKGEILTIVRGLFRLLGKAPPPFEEFRVNLIAGNPVAKHNIKALACKLRGSR